MGKSGIVWVIIIKCFDFSSRAIKFEYKYRNSRWIWYCWSCGFFRRCATFIPVSLRARHTVSALTSISVTSFNSFTSWVAVLAFPEVIDHTNLCLSVAVSIADRPPLFWVSCFAISARILFTVVWLIPSCVAIWHDERPLLIKEMILLCTC